MLASQDEIRVYSGLCPDVECRTKLFFPSYAASSIECTGCGKHYNKELLNNVQLIKDADVALRNLLRSVLLPRSALKKGPDLVKVKGYSNYHCRLISPLLTKYGMDNKTSEAKLLREMGQGDPFDCSHVGDRAFAIEHEYLDTPGYGRDKSGSMNYLSEITEDIKVVNDNEERLVPLHVDGDGHCLVHALSRALVGREIFWHPLMVNLQNHIIANLSKYKALFIDFIGQDEWDLIISEAGPDYQPADDQPLGLRNIHIFGLANVLHRPILLLDSISGMQSSADYSGTFLPALVPIHLCKKKDGKLIPPLAIAWSNSGRNHYIPLVNIRNKPLTKIPSWIIPKAWGISDDHLKTYIEFDNNDLCTIGGSRTMSDSYIHRLMKAMDDKFFELNRVSASLVTEVHQFIFKPSGVVGVRPRSVINRTRQRVQDKSLMKCIHCQALSENECPVNQEWLLPGGKLYVSAAHVEGGLVSGQTYSFPDHQLFCSYDVDNDVLKPIKFEGLDFTSCIHCKGSLRVAKADGSPVYLNRDRTTNPVTGKSNCGCGYKHFWDGNEYDNLPEAIPVALEWGGKSIKDTVYWFEHESDESLNSNVYAVAGKLVQKYFPGEFGSERLVQKVVDTILRQTARKEGDNKGARPDIPNLPPSASPSKGTAEGTAEGTAVDPFIPSKTILTGQKKKTFHKEELNQSDTEKRLKIKTEHHAAITQQRQTKLQRTPEKSPPKQQGNKTNSTSSPTPSSPRLPRTDKKIRLSSSSGGQHYLTLPLNVTYSQLQDAIHNELGVLPGHQKIKYGYPPSLLNPPEQGQEDEPIPIQHGDRVMVEALRPPEPVPQPPTDVEMQEEKKMDVAGAMGGDGVDDPAKQEERKKEETPMDVDFDSSALVSVLMSALSGNLTNDWDAACTKPQMFERGGYYYNLVTNDLGPLIDDQHFHIPRLPNKVFAYKLDKDRIELCLGKIHIPVQPLNQEMLTLAHSQQLSAGTSTTQPSSSIINTEASFSGVINKQSGSSQKAFSGEGRSLSGSSPVSPRQPHGHNQTPSLPSRQISEASMISATITSGADGPVSGTATNQATEERPMTEERPQTDKQAEKLPVVDEQRAGKTAEGSAVVEESNEIDKSAEEAPMGELDPHIDTPTEEPSKEREPSEAKRLSSSVVKLSEINSTLSSSTTPDADMTNQKSPIFVGEETDAKGVSMETDYHGNDPTTKDKQCDSLGDTNESSKATRIATETHMDVDQSDTKNILFLECFAVSQDSTTGRPNLDNAFEEEPVPTTGIPDCNTELNQDS